MTTITLLKNGPVKLESTTSIVYESGQAVDTPSVCALCRCGQTKNGPFCDGSHAVAGFTDEREINTETLQFYPGSDFSIHFNRSICCGAGRCVKTLPAVFSEENSHDWISPDNDSFENVKRVVEQCPSGALSLQVGDTVVGADPVSAARIDIVPDGPLIVQGVELMNPPPATHSDSYRYALCRCGRSKNKPYCDYSHAEEV